MFDYDNQGRPMALIPAKPFWAGIAGAGKVPFRVTVSLGKYAPVKSVAG